ncbi:type II toxin-antitoxin system RelE/ParE family toxin [Mesorhizobium ventifaucium]|uniref:Plasmid stabilization protein n=1 Tax=Mesorhizobium ventifaucium TaxID=666020 RepID=A0ABM9E761_9HYPH|nr:type II toxin-antitoxin system RelE/ParE family toxin [Mesorhizobium ventifaucium]CAH2404974.1 Putative plasmid stabilization protein [Mesorhizobium ventifaucium]
MTDQVVFSAAAEKDVAELLAYLVPEAGERTARAWVDRLIVYCEGFATFPERGTRRDDIARVCVRLVIDGGRRSLSRAFRVDGNFVVILRMLHGGRALEAVEDIDRE